MQTILGSGGAIGNELAKALTHYTNEIRLVSRNPKTVNPGDALMSADLTDKGQVYNAVESSEIVYLTVGLPYNTKIWENTWPVIMKNVMEACIHFDAKLVFFDNIYLYDCNCLDGMTEETPINPCSKKGKVRETIARMLMDEVENGNLTALIARSADFYGPAIGGNSVLTESVFDNLAKGKKADWLGSVNFKHSFTYTPDAGKATALLGNTPDAFNDVWHLLTQSNPFTGKEWIEAIASELDKEPNYRVLSKGMAKIAGLFVPVIKELGEMMYQYDRDYVFDSSKFEKRFNMKPTMYLKGIQEIVNSDYSPKQ